MKKHVYLNGQYVNAAAAAISVFDSGFLYGEGLFETFRSYNGKVFGLREHLDRMRKSAGFFNIPFNLSETKLAEIIRRLSEMNSEYNCVFRLVLTRGRGIMWKGQKQMPPTIAVLTRELHTDMDYLRQTGVKLIVSSTLRDSSNPLFRHKTLSYMQNVIARSTALKEKAFDAVFLDSRKRVLEGAISNLFIIKNNAVLTPPLSLNVLPGITRNCVLQIAKMLKLDAAEKEITINDLIGADEAFLTNSVVGIMPIKQAGNRKIRGKVPGKLTYLLSEVYTIELARKLRLNNDTI